jgi:hypothetical protein
MTVLRPPAPCLTAAPAADRVIVALFLITVALFVMGLLAL